MALAKHGSKTSSFLLEDEEDILKPACEAQQGQHPDVGAESPPPVFFRIVHTAVGKHKMVDKGGLRTSDLAIDVLKPVRDLCQLHESGEDTVALQLDMRSKGAAALALWMSDPRIAFDDLLANMQQWTVVPGALWQTDALDVNPLLELIAHHHGDGVMNDRSLAQCCRDVISACLTAKAYGASQHVYMPGEVDGHQARAIRLMVAAGVLASCDAVDTISESLSVGRLRLSDHALGIVSRTAAIQLHVAKPFRLFSNRVGTAAEDCSVLELMLQLDEDGFSKVLDPSRPRELAPFLPPEKSPKTWYSKSARLPCKEYLIALVSDIGAKKVYHMQPQQYYKCLLAFPEMDLMPNQPAQFYRAFMTRKRAGCRPRADEADASGNVPPFSGGQLRDDDVVDLTQLADQASVPGPEPAVDIVPARRKKRKAVVSESESVASDEDAEVNGQDSDMEPEEPGTNMDSISILHDEAEPAAQDLRPACAKAASGSSSSSSCHVQDGQAVQLAGARQQAEADAPPRMPAARGAANEFFHGAFRLVRRDDKRALSITAFCPYHTWRGPNGFKCWRDTRLNQPDEATVVLRQRFWCNLARQWQCNPGDKDAMRAARDGQHGCLCSSAIFSICANW